MPRESNRLRLTAVLAWHLYKQTPSVSLHPTPSPPPLPPRSACSSLIARRQNSLDKMTRVTCIDGRRFKNSLAHLQDLKKFWGNDMISPKTRKG